MMPSLENIVSFKEALIALGWLLPRMLVAFSLLPLFNSQILPGLLRNSLALALCLVLVPVMLMQMHNRPPVATQLMPFLLMKEALIGLLLGFFMAIPFWGLEAVGFFIDNQRGASIASSFNPLTGNDSSPLGIMFNQSFMVYFLVSGGFGLMLTVLYQSYLIWSPLEFSVSFHHDAAKTLIAQLDRLMALGIVLSAPVILVMFLAELGLALISRFAPQLQVFFLAMPIKSGVAVFMLTVYIGTLFRYTNSEISQYTTLLTQIRDVIR
jgi:type III secretion protein T